MSPCFLSENHAICFYHSGKITHPLFKGDEAAMISKISANFGKSPLKNYCFQSELVVAQNLGNFSLRRASF